MNLLRRTIALLVFMASCSSVLTGVAAGNSQTSHKFEVAGQQEVILVNPSRTSMAMTMQLEVQFPPGSRALVVEKSRNAAPRFALIDQPQASAGVMNLPAVEMTGENEPGSPLTLTRNSPLAPGSLRLVLDVGRGTFVVRAPRSLKVQLRDRVLFHNSETFLNIPQGGADAQFQLEPADVRHHGDMLFLNLPCDSLPGFAEVDVSFTAAGITTPKRRTFSCPSEPMVLMEDSLGAWRVSGRWAGRGNSNPVLIMG